MSSGFVSGGTVDNETERDEEWKRAAQELEDKRRAKEDLAKQHDGKSLYEILQANKDKKQADFEEKARFKLHNHLNDDEADYLDSILEKKRQEEFSVKKETAEGLAAFRKQQEEEERKALEQDSAEVPTKSGGQWGAIGRKRKKGPEAGLLKGVKLKKLSSAGEESAAIQSAKTEDPAPSKINAVVDSPGSSKPTSHQPLASKPATASNVLSLGLGYASSDED